MKQEENNKKMEGNVKVTSEEIIETSEDVKEKSEEKVEETETLAPADVPSVETKGKEKDTETETQKEEFKTPTEAEKPQEGNQRPKRRGFQGPTREEIVAAWEPKTKLGKDVKDCKIKNIDEILDKNKKILESEIIDSLLKVKSDLLSIGQSKGKFGGGKRRAWRQTQRKTREGNVPTFSTLAAVGDEEGHVGIGSGKAMETLPARDKAIKKAKLNVIKVKRDCAGFDCSCSEKHTVPFEVIGKSGSVKVILIPAPQGTGLVVANELKKILKLAGIKDVYSKTYGRKRTTFNLVKACIEALKRTNPVEVKK